MTLIEIIIVSAIVAVAAGGVAISFQQVQRSKAKSSAAKLSAAIRYLYDQSVVSGKYFRLTIDLATDSYKAEKSDDRFYLPPGKEQSPGGGKAFDFDAEQKRLDEAEAREKENAQGMAKQLQPPPTLKRAHFQSFSDSNLPTVAMSGAFIRDVVTPRQREPYTEGKAFLYFFPDGHTEQAVIHIQMGRRPVDSDGTERPLRDPDEKPTVYTLFVHGLTGRVEVKAGDIAPPRQFDADRDEGDAEMVN